MTDTEQKLAQAFPGSFINQCGEFIAHSKASEYFNLESCKDDAEIKCKVLEWFSRGACKAEPYRSKEANDKFHKFMLDGINEFLGTSFSARDMDSIYIYLGNGVNMELCIEFIESGFNLRVLKND